MIRLYFDEDSMDKALVRALKARGVDVITALQEDMIEQDDEVHLRFATWGLLPEPPKNTVA